MDYGLDDFALFDDEPSPFARWVWPALVLSLAVHVGVFFWLRDYQLPAFDEAPPPPPKTFTLARVELPPEKPVAPEKSAEPKPASAPQAVQLPRDTPALGAQTADVKTLPAAPKIENAMLAEKPRIDPASYQKAVRDAQEGGVKSVTREMDQVRSDLLTDKPGVSGKPLLDLAPTADDSGAPSGRLGELAGGKTPGFSNLDELLAQTGPLSKETAPIRMDADVLYAYDSYQLEQGALTSLEKLGTIIQRNPQLNFSIEGHSDSFGSDAYNLQLSQLRAESVKAWLVQFMGIDPARITTRGFGKTRLIVPASGTIEEQSVNRRVEIVLQDRSTPR